MEKNKYPKFLEPLTLKNGITLKNRAIMGSIHTGLEESWNGFSKAATYYARRAAGDIGLIITGGFSPNMRGWLKPFGGALMSRLQIPQHRKITSAVHEKGGKICLQILHAGRYGYHPFIQSASKLKSPITPFKPSMMSDDEIKSTIEDYARCARLAQTSRYDGIEIMGSEGYLINQFLSKRVNTRSDSWGGSLDKRIKIALEIIKAIKEVVRDEFILIFRISIIDLVKDGMKWDEVSYFAKKLEESGVHILNSGIGWHEARVPTIATLVPRAHFSEVTKKLKDIVNIPVVACNRINTPEVAESILEKNQADLISMARPLLADPDFVLKAKKNRSEEINTCIACNQACLDHIFKNKIATCLVNPLAAYEYKFKIEPTQNKKKVAVVGAGPAGLSFALYASQRGHEVHLFEKREKIGGQFLYAEKIPGKEEFSETLRYFEVMLKKYKVNLKLSYEAKMEDLKEFDEVILSSGVRPRVPKIPGIDESYVHTYQKVIGKQIEIGNNVALIGAGGIGFDMAEYLSDPHSSPISSEEFNKDWGVDFSVESPGGLIKKDNSLSKRNIYLLQRKKEKLGIRLGKTTGWIKRKLLKDRGVKMLSSIEYEKIENQKLYIKKAGKEMVIDVDNVVICAGQLSVLELKEKMEEANLKHHIIGGALKAGELDAKRAIREGMELAIRI